MCSQTEKPARGNVAQAFLLDHFTRASRSRAPQAQLRGENRESGQHLLLTTKWQAHLLVNSQKHWAPTPALVGVMSP